MEVFLDILFIPLLKLASENHVIVRMYGRLMLMTASITLMEAYMIETLLQKGMEVPTIIKKLKKGDVEDLNTFDGSFDYDDLLQAYHKDPENMKQAIEGDYKIKFISVYGIKQLLQLKYDLNEEKDYKREGNKFLFIPLDEVQLKSFHTLLSPHWKIERVGNNEAGKQKVHVLHMTEK